MPTVVFTSNLQRHLECPTQTVEASTLKQALDLVFDQNPRLRGYIVNDQGELRKHVVVFIDGEQAKDKQSLTDAVKPNSEIYVMQALSGGSAVSPKQTLWVGTRKGLFQFADSNEGWRITQRSFLGEPVTMVAHDPRDGTHYAALNLGHFGVKLHRSKDQGATWEECKVPVYPPKPEETDDTNPWTLQQICCLETDGKDEPGGLWAGTLPGGLFHSKDGGDSWQLVTSLWNHPNRQKWFGGGYDHPVIHSLCVDPRDSNSLSLAVSCGGVWHSKDFGESWEVGCKGMTAEYMPPDQQEDPNIQDPHRMVRCPGSPETLWVQHHNGIFLSRDGGWSWKQIENVPPSKFGFAVAVHPTNPDTAWFVPAIKDECRIPVDGELVVSRTRNGGENFDVLRTGLPQDDAYDLVYRHALEIDAAGETLAFGSTTGGLWTSDDQGEHWSTVSENLPPIYCVRFL